MGRHKYVERPLTQIELNRRHSDKAASIDAGLDEAIAQIDWDRRNSAERDLVQWVKTYCLGGMMLDEAPPMKGEEVLREMEVALTAHQKYLICMGRGSGKTSYVECATMFAMATGMQKYTVIISNNQNSAQAILNDIYRFISESDSAFFEDYPEITYPFWICQGSFRRRMLYHGRQIEIAKNAKQILFPNLTKEDGTEFATSGSVIAVRSIQSSIRGMKRGTIRPSLILLDDLQDADIAANDESVSKLLTFIKKDVEGLSGKERLSILQTATPIQSGDLVEKLREDKTWKTQIFKTVISFPERMDMWKQYFVIYDRENMEGKEHSESLEFYRANFDAMNEGADVFNENRFSETDGHISAIQKFLEIQHEIGDSNFAAEYQMQPKRYSAAIDISPQLVMSRMNEYRKLQVPDGYVATFASIDLNLSYAITLTILSFRPDNTAVVIYHYLHKCHIPQSLNETEYNQRVYEELVKIGKRLKGLNIHIDGWAIDANGTAFEAVTSFTKNSVALCGIPAIGMIGKASHLFSPFVKSKLRNESAKTVLCGDNAEHIKAGSGKKWVFWDSDFYKAIAQKAILASVGNIGSLSLYKGDTDEHAEFARQFTAERLQYIKHRPDGKDFYQWQDVGEKWDYLDSVAQAYGIAANQGISGANFQREMPINQNRILKRRMIPSKKKIRIV